MHADFSNSTKHTQKPTHFKYRWAPFVATFITVDQSQLRPMWPGLKQKKRKKNSRTEQRTAVESSPETSISFSLFLRAVTCDIDCQRRPQIMHLLSVPPPPRHPHTEAAPLTGTTSVTTKWEPPLLRTSSSGSSPKAPSDLHLRTPLPLHLYLKLGPATYNIKIKIPCQVIIQ